MNPTNTTLRILSNRAVHQTLQGIVLGSAIRATTPDTSLAMSQTAVLGGMYGAGKYAMNKEYEAQASQENNQTAPFEKYSALKKTGWFALGLGIAYADQLYFIADKLMQ